MEIVIKIDEYDKEWIHNAHDIPNEIKSKVVDAIENGTPLPKGHGRLIDYDDLIEGLDRYGRRKIKYQLPYSPTIIFADKEGDSE